MNKILSIQFSKPNNKERARRQMSMIINEDFSSLVLASRNKKMVHNHSQEITFKETYNQSNSKTKFEAMNTINTERMAGFNVLDTRET